MSDALPPGRAQARADFGDPMQPDGAQARADFGDPLPPDGAQDRIVADEARLGRLARAGLLAVLVLVFGLGGLAAFLPLAGAVVASGTVDVVGQVKRISVPYGGTVAAIEVQNGDRVRAGQVLVRLDDRVAGASADYAALGRDRLEARMARLRAQSRGAARLSARPGNGRAAPDANSGPAFNDEREALRLSRRAQADQAQELRAQIAQAQADVRRALADEKAYTAQQDLIGRELNQTRQLYDRRLTTLDRLSALERAAVGVSASRTTASEQAAASRARVVELRAQLAALSSNARAQAAIELGQAEAALADAGPRAASAADEDARTRIRAPVAGTVEKLSVSTIGSVVRAGDTVAEVVPAKGALEVIARIPVNKVDRVHAGSEAHLRLSAFDARTTPELVGRVLYVASDRSEDTATGAAWYEARVAIPSAQLKRLDGKRLAVGMPVDVFVQTGEHSLLSYILRPLSDQLRRAFKE